MLFQGVILGKGRLILIFFISETCGWHADLPLEVSLLSFNAITEDSYSYHRAVRV
jgi:hypothetical protein